MPTNTLTPAKIAFNAVKLKYGKPKTKLRRASLQPLPELKKKADRALQDWYRREWGGMACECCGVDFQLMHHIVEKSASAGLRFEETNLVFLCHACHARHHLRGDPAVLAAIIRKRGMKWFEKLMKLKVERKGMQLDRKYLEEQLIKYK